MPLQPKLYDIWKKKQAKVKHKKRGKKNKEEIYNGREFLQII